MCAIHAGHDTHTIALKFILLTSDLLSEILALAQEHYSIFQFTILFSSYHFNHDLVSTTYSELQSKKNIPNFPS